MTLWVLKDSAGTYLGTTRGDATTTSIVLARRFATREEAEAHALTIGPHGGRFGLPWSPTQITIEGQPYTDPWRNAA